MEEVKIYTTMNCDNCKQAKEYLNDKGIEYQEINLKEKENREARAYYRSLGIKTLPVITGLINGEEFIIYEFDKDLLDSLQWMEKLYGEETKKETEGKRGKEKR